MTSNTLTTYLNDHLAGSVAALELLDHLLSPSSPHADVLKQLRRDIEEDQRALQQLLADLGGHESAVRKAAAWVTEKLGRAKLRFDDPGEENLGLLEALETLGLGIHGKLALWRALSEVKARVAQLSDIDFGRLQERARSQFEQVERLRLAAARRSLVP